MAKYFEAVNNDGSICVDDTYQNLELLEVVELKNAKKTLISDSPYGENHFVCRLLGIIYIFMIQKQVTKMGQNVMT